MAGTGGLGLGSDWRSVSIVVVVLITLLPTLALSCPLALKWPVEPTCPDAAYVLARVETLAEPDCSRWKSVEAVVTLQRGSVESAAMIAMNTMGTRYQRVLKGEDCAALAEAVALVMALVVGPGPGLAASLPAATAPVFVVPTVLEPEVLRPEPKPRLATSVDPLTEKVKALPVVPQWFVGIGIETELGSVGTAGIGGQVTVGAAAEPWLAEAGLGAVTTVTAVQPATSVRLSLYSGVLRGCREVFGAPSVALCAVMQAGVLSARGLGIAEPTTSYLAWGAFGCGVRLAWPRLERFGGSVSVELLAPLQRGRFYVDNVGENGEVSSTKVAQTWPVVGHFKVAYAWGKAATDS